MWRRAQKQSVSSSSSPTRPLRPPKCCPFLARMTRGANAARHVWRCWLVAAKCSNSATLPGRAGGESLGLVDAGCNVLLLHYGAPSSCRRTPSVAGPLAVAVAAFRAQTLGARRRIDRADLGRGAVGHPMTSAATALRFHDLTLGYDRHPAVHHLNGVVEQGSLTAVVGPNGGGKAAVFKGIVGA